ncbi:MAG: ribosome small subunit-dependent GTPase A [Planctomycetota bacterium]|nr:MAG: ribosome small subunit-dependent GTPase A [Planctomycetota bacterium]
MAAKKKHKIRADFRKNRSGRARPDDWTRRFHAEGEEADLDAVSRERISGKGELSRRRTVLVEMAADEESMLLDVDPAAVKLGRVLAVQGLLSTVQEEGGATYMCATRRLLKTMATDERHVVAAGDFVMFRPVTADEGIIERVEPRQTVLSRATRGRQQIMVANADQLLIVASAAEPYLKPNLIDRLLISAHQTGLRPLVCINKIDLIDPASLAPLVGTYSQMGYRVLLLSATTGIGIDRLRRELAGRASVVAGQSGVGKSSLLNAVDPELALRVGRVSDDTQKGRHTTTTAQLWPLASGGYVFDTPGIRQFQLWDVIPAEVAGYFRDLRPYINHCRFPNCTHTHETQCAVKDAVADGWLDLRRYESYCHLFAGEID